jgi:hypothetical protein
MVLSVGAMAAVAPTGQQFGAGVAAAQQQGTGHGPPPPEPPTINPLDQPNEVPDSVHARMEQERVKAANDDRHKKLAADADKLIELSNELKADVDKTSKDELSMEVMRKAGEIEKLAHDVQGRMKD